MRPRSSLARRWLAPGINHMAVSLIYIYIYMYMCTRSGAGVCMQLRVYSVYVDMSIPLFYTYGMVCELQNG